jgi:hypothetical protein
MKRPGPEQHHQPRHIRYIDERIQGRLLAATLVLDVIVFATAMVVLYFHLNQVIDEQLFRIHMGPQEGLPVLVSELLRVAPYIVLIKVLMMMLVEWVWLNYVRRIVVSLRTAFQAAAFLDLRLRPAPVVEHDVLDTAGDWIQDERLRCAQLRQLAEELRPDMDKESARQLIQEMRRHLPPA